MPNHVTNHLEITGEIDQVNLLIKTVGGGTQAEYGKAIPCPFDFEKILPSPKEFEGVQSGGCKIGEEYVTIWRTNENGENVKISEKEIAGWMQKYGATNWYEWHVQNWGTKWSAYDMDREFSLSSNKDGQIKATIRFNTAWSAPHPVIEKLSEMFKELEISLTWADEDTGQNVGTMVFSGGETIEEDIPEGGSKWAFEVAFRLNPDSEDWYMWDEETQTYIYTEDKIT